MKTVNILSLVILLAITGVVSAAFVTTQSGNKVTAPVPAMSKGFAVVELFTSEGCSSCPAADAVIAKIEKERADKPVYILAYHVDYWNRLGWKDVFSSAQYSRRQSQYAAWFHLNSVYTPQVIVNGKTEFTGSQEGTLRNAIHTGLQNDTKATLTLTNLKLSGNRLLLNYATTLATANHNLLLALIQKNAVTVVKNGENGGRTLHHVQIVTDIQNAALTAAEGETGIKLPANLTARNYEIIALVQNTATGEIAAATRAALPESLVVNN